jgi:hypothetical protein
MRTSLTEKACTLFSGPNERFNLRQASMSGFRDWPSIAIPGTRYLNTPRFFASSTISILIIWMISN